MATVKVSEVCKRWPMVLAQYAGEEVEVTSRGQTVAWLRVRGSRKRRAKVAMPDFSARLKRVFGQRAISAADAARLTVQNKSAF